MFSLIFLTNKIFFFVDWVAIRIGKFYFLFTLPKAKKCNFNYLEPAYFQQVKRAENRKNSFLKLEAVFDKIKDFIVGKEKFWNLWCKWHLKVPYNI